MVLRAFLQYKSDSAFATRQITLYSTHPHVDLADDLVLDMGRLTSVETVLAPYRYSIRNKSTTTTHEKSRYAAKGRTNSLYFTNSRQALTWLNKTNSAGRSFCHSLPKPPLAAFISFRAQSSCLDNTALLL